MPDISHQMSYIQQLQDVRNPNSPMGALDRLGSSIGNAWQGYQGRTDEQDAVKFFMGKDVNPQTIQEFSTTHPQMPLMDVYKTAGTLATQKKAQQAKDYFTSLQGYLAGGGDPDPEKLQEIASKYTLLQPKEIMDMSNGVMQQTDFMATVKEKKKARENLESYRKTIGGLTSPVPNVDKVSPGNVAQDPEDQGAVIDTAQPTMQTPKLDLNKTLSAIMQFQAPKEAAESLVHVATLQKDETPNTWIISTDGKNTKQFVGPKTASILVGTGAFTKDVEAKPEGKASLFDTFSVGYMDKLKSDPLNANKTEAQLKLMVADEAERRGIEKGVTINTARGQSYGDIRIMPMLDTKNGNSPVSINANQINDANLNEPGRYIPAGIGVPALNKTALVEDIRGNIQQTRQSLKNIPTEFTSTQRAALAYVLKSSDTKGAATSFLQGSVASTMSPEQIDYATDLFQLIENGMAMRSVLGAGQGSDELRAAIRSTIPGAATGSKAQANMQLDKFEKVLDRLSRGIPNVPLRTTGNAPNSNQPGFNNEVPQAAIDYLKAHPDQAAAFDAKYGNGNKVSQSFLERR